MMMKQILSILFFIFTFLSLQAQASLELYYSTTKLKNGDTIFAQVKPDIMDQQFINVKNISISSKNVLVKKNVTQLVPETSITFCWAECYPPETMISPEAVQIQAGTLCENFSSDFEASKEGISYVLYTFFDENNGGDSVSVWIQYNCSKTAIPSFTKEVRLAAFPNPATHYVTIDYTITNAENAFLRIYNIAGELMYEKALIQGYNKVTIDISEWNTGIYMYSLRKNNHTYLSKKLIITK